jgi:hypothetical protein
MSILASQLIYNIKNLRAGGVQSDDTKLSDRQVFFIINYYRAKLIRQEYGNHKVIGREDVQDLGKVELINVDPHECGCPTGSCILRTKEKIPRSLRLQGEDHGFTFVGMYAGQAWQETTWNAAPWTTYAKYTGNDTKWFIKGRYLYILNPRDIRMNQMNIQGLFDDPQEAEQFRTCSCDNGETCNRGFDFDYPISADKVDTLMKMMMQSEINWTTLIPEDISNNSLDDN